MTWQPAPEILAGYQRALQLCTETYLPKLLVPGPPIDLQNREDILKILKPVLASKQFGSQEILAPLVADACLSVLETTNGKIRLPIEAVRTVKLIGASVADSQLLSGYVAKSALETVLKSADDCKVAVYACGFEASSTEAKSTVLMKNADDLLNYNKTEERKMKEIVDGIAASGVKVVVTGGNLSDMALHFLDRNDMICLRVGSKWELRRLCQAVNATALVRLGAPTPDEMGHCESIRQTDIGGKTVTIFENNVAESKLATIVLRASTTTVLNDLERAVDDGVHAVAGATRDGRLVYGGGAVETALSTLLEKEAAKTPGLEQYALSAFAKALHVVPRTLIENAGANTTQVLADLQTAHAAVDSATVCDAGVDIERENQKNGTASMEQKGVYDLLATKISALQLAVDAVVTILKIDQIIMSKPAGGPKPQG